MNIVQWIVENKYGKNEFAAAHIANGLELYKLSDETARQERVKLYRRWRDSKAFNTTKECFKMAIEGKEPPELFEKIAEAE